MNTVPEIKAALAQCMCTEDYYKCPMTRSVVHTDGVQTLMGMASAYWLIDAIISHMVTKRIFKTDQMLQGFQLWELKVTGSSAVLTCKRDSGPGQRPVVRQKIEYTDFPLDKIKIYAEPTELADGRTVMVLLLPSER
tara:strand:- start:221 stop:631 length:411 start_codon:yes stop_codon:yes gene_type:complete